MFGSNKMAGGFSGPVMPLLFVPDAIRIRNKQKPRSTAGLKSNVTHFTLFYVLLHFIPKHHHTVKHIYQHRMGFVNITRQYLTA